MTDKIVTELIEEELGKIAYDAYFAYSSGHSLISGQELPMWEAQRPDVKNAWIAVGAAVRDAVHA